MTTPKTIEEQTIEKFTPDIKRLGLKIATIRSSTLRKVLKLYGDSMGLWLFWDNRHKDGRKRLPSLKAIMLESSCSKRTAQDYRSSIEVMREIEKLRQEIANFAGPMIMEQLAVAPKAIKELG